MTQRSNEMTREDAREALWSNGHGDSNWIIAKIFNDHETAIEILMKANEEEISRHFNECEKHEAQLKAKDEEIERLKVELKRGLNGPLKSVTINQMGGGKDEY